LSNEDSVCTIRTQHQDGVLFVLLVCILRSRGVLVIKKSDSSAEARLGLHTGRSAPCRGSDIIRVWVIILVQSSCPHFQSTSVLCIVDQYIFWSLTAYKYRYSIRLGLSRNPTLRLVIRDTSLSCLQVAICCKHVSRF
jgi:hypothetical protein